MSTGEMPDREAGNLARDFGERWVISREAGRLKAVSRDGKRELSGSSEGVLRCLLSSAEFPVLPARWD